jgi:hypothetical protein
MSSTHSRSGAIIERVQDGLSPIRKLVGLVATVEMANDNRGRAGIVATGGNEELRVLRLRKPQNARLGPLRMPALILMTASI